MNILEKVMGSKKLIENHILNIVQNESVREQADLQEILKRRGYDIPQATLSRKLKKLNIAKVDGIYKIVDFSSSSLPVVLGMKISDFGIIVLHTHPGNANSLGYFIDQKYVSYDTHDSQESPILGTIAGDDTLVVIVKNKKALKETQSMFETLFPYIKST
jgi:transcriptional regulator of arginine metabolism